MTIERTLGRERDRVVLVRDQGPPRYRVQVRADVTFLVRADSEKDAVLGAKAFLRENRGDIAVPYRPGCGGHDLRVVLDECGEPEVFRDDENEFDGGVPDVHVPAGGEPVAPCYPGTTPEGDAAMREFGIEPVDLDEPAAPRPGRLADSLSDLSGNLDEAVAAGDLGAIANAAGGVRRLVLALDAWDACMLAEYDRRNGPAGADGLLIRRSASSPAGR